MIEQICDDKINSNNMSQRYDDTIQLKCRGANINII